VTLAPADPDRIRHPISAAGREEMEVHVRAILARHLFVVAVAGLLLAADPRAHGQFDAGPARPRNRIDEIVFAQLKTLWIRPAALCSDAAFLRRVHLDLIGTLPTADEARSFLADTGPDKRGTLVDRLLAREEYADFWAMRWSDALRIKSEFPINLWPNAVQAYHRWIRTAIRDNVPWDRVAREILVSNGSNFRDAPVNFYRAVQGREPSTLAAAVALAFMGTRADGWPKARLAAMGGFFSQIAYKPTGEWKEEIVYFDPAKPRGPARFPDGSAAKIAPNQDPREVFAAWLTAPGNPWFARSLANRTWFWLVGRGIVHEADDLRPDNPPVNADLLAYLERELVASRYDVKRLMKLVVGSSTYQLSSVPAKGGSGAAADANFAHALVRPVEAEVLADALCQITGTHEQYASPIPEPFTYIPPDQRSIGLADGSITSTFLETFGRAARDTGLLSERHSRVTAAQRLWLLNSNDMQRKLQQGPGLLALMAGKTDAREAVSTLYLAILSRLPTDAEMATAVGYLEAAGANRRAAGQDLAWALINTAEFRYRH
jgi:hypothetical protein